MDDTKKWWQSKTIWAAAVAAIAGLVSLTGHTIDAGTQADLVNKISAIADGVVFISSIAAGFFRKNATVTIAPVLPPKANP